MVVIQDDVLYVSQSVQTTLSGTWWQHNLRGSQRNEPQHRVVGSEQSCSERTMGVDRLVFPSGQLSLLISPHSNMAFGSHIHLVSTSQTCKQEVRAFVRWIYSLSKAIRYTWGSNCHFNHAQPVCNGFSTLNDRTNYGTSLFLDNLV